MDRAQFPREKICAGWITPSVLETLEIDPEGYRQGRLLQEIRTFRTALVGGREIVTTYPQTVSYGIRRWEFDHYLLVRSAARHRLGEPVRAIERVPDGWLVNGEIRTRLLIGAGGHYCPVARALSPGKRAEKVIAAQGYEFSLDLESQECGIPAGVPALFFTDDLQGYGWVLRKGRYLNVGLGSRESGGLPARMERFWSFLKSRWEIGEIAPRFKGHAYLPYAAGTRPVVGDAALLIGDAAGVAYPESGEGILPAVESAIMAVHAILAAHGDYRREKLQRYAELLAGRFGAADNAPPTPAWLRRHGGAVLLSSRWLTRRVLLDRWFLHQGQERLPLLEPRGGTIAPTIQKQPT